MQFQITISVTILRQPAVPSRTRDNVATLMLPWKQAPVRMAAPSLRPSTGRLANTGLSRYVFFCLHLVSVAHKPVFVL